MSMHQPPSYEMCRNGQSRQYGHPHVPQQDPYLVSYRALRDPGINPSVSSVPPGTHEGPRNPEPQTKTFTMKEGILICLREMLGMAILTYVGCFGNLSFLSLGFTYSALQASADIYSVGGLHLNPVLTMATAIVGKMRPLYMMGPMVICQLIGCVLGAGLCRGSQTKESYLTTSIAKGPQYNIHKLKDSEKYLHVLLSETIFTAVLTVVFLGLLPFTKRPPASREEAEHQENRKYKHALFVGLAICGLTAGVGTLTALMNPFLAFGPMAIWVAEQPKQLSPEPRYSPYFDIPQEDKFTKSELWNGHWVYWIGPVAGALIAAVAFRLQGPNGEERP